MESLESFRLRQPTAKTNPFLYTSKGLKVAGGIRRERCVLYVLTGLNGSSIDLYLQLFEEAPRAGLVPAFVIAVPANSHFTWVPANSGRVFEKLFFGCSSTLADFTQAPEGSGFWLDAEGMVFV